MEFETNYSFDEEEYDNFLQDRFEDHMKYVAGQIDKYRQKYPQVVSDCEKLYDALERDRLIKHVRDEDELIVPSYFLSVFSKEGSLDNYLTATMITSPNRQTYEEMYGRYEVTREPDRKTIGDVFESAFELISDFRYEDDHLGA